MLNAISADEEIEMAAILSDLERLGTYIRRDANPDCHSPRPSLGFDKNRFEVDVKRRVIDQFKAESVDDLSGPPYLVDP